MYRDLCLQRFHLLLLSAYLTKEVYLKAAVSGGKVSVKVHFRFSSPSFENTANVREVTSPSFQHANWYLQTSKLSKLFYLSLSTSTLPVSLLSSRSKHQQDSSAALKERKASLWPVLSERSRWGGEKSKMGFNRKLLLSFVFIQGQVLLLALLEASSC